MVDLIEEYERARARLEAVGLDALTERDRVLVTVVVLEADVNNGGFDQYYLNGSGDTAFFAPEALRMIGAHAMADIVSRANALFGESGPPRDRNTRQDHLFALTANDDELFAAYDAAFHAYPDDISALLVAYVRR